MEVITQKEKDNLLLLSHFKGCWLNGVPAFIKGRLNRFATVYQHDTLLKATYSWQTTKRIMNKDRRFIS